MSEYNLKILETTVNNLENLVNMYMETGNIFLAKLTHSQIDGIRGAYTDSVNFKYNHSERKWELSII